MTALAGTKKLLRRVLSPSFAGFLDYCREPARGEAWGGPFNGQVYRQTLFRTLVERLKPVAIIETGTYLGTTTAFMAEAGVPIFTIETDPYSYGFAQGRLRQCPNVSLRLGDSRAELSALFSGSHRSIRTQTLFAYLDAHWNADLPLVEELEIVFAQCSGAIVMVDDFQVPFDAGYGYDDYGTDKALTLDYIAPTVAKHKLKVFYPSTPSSKEGGARRGCIVLAKAAVLSGVLSSISLLRPVSV